MTAPRILLAPALLALAAAQPVAAANVTAASGTSVARSAPATAKPPVRGTKVPEPADFALFAAGVIGLLLGRRVSRSRRGGGDQQ
jgi:hypothetical protein